MSREPRPPDDPVSGDEEEDFASMLDASYEAAATYREGQTVEGRVVSVGREVAFIDVGGKGEATIDLDELLDEDGRLDVRVGDIVQGVVVSTDGGVKLSHRLARRAASREQLGAAFRAGLPVEGRVEKAIRGGFEVRMGGQRAFCPISQIDSSFTEDPAVHEGHVYTFRITEYKDDGKNLVVSRRALLADEERERSEQVRREAVPGAVLTGRVVSVRDYGAFVDLGGGVQGLLHVSEMDWSRVTNPADVVRPGEEIAVKVLRIDAERGTIALGLKQLQPDPWSGAADTYEAGQRLEGTVARLAEFAVFIELEPGIEALAHASTFPPTARRDVWRTQYAPGARVAVEILAVDVERKRIGVAVLEEGSAQQRHDAREHAERQDREPADGFGSLADKLRGALRPPRDS